MTEENQEKYIVFYNKKAGALYLSKDAVSFAWGYTNNTIDWEVHFTPQRDISIFDNKNNIKKEGSLEELLNSDLPSKVKEFLPYWIKCLEQKEITHVPIEKAQ